MKEAIETVQALGFPPERIGGTEIYVTALAQGLARRGVRSVMAAPQTEGERENRDHAGVRVETYPINASPSFGEMRHGDAHEGFDRFRALLTRHRGAIYHQHSWTRGCGPHHLRAARAAGMRTLITMHVPSNVCLRGDMLLFGETPCDGYVDEHRCAACWSHSRGAPRALARALAHVPLAMSAIARKRSGRVAGALAARAIAAQKRDDVREMIGNSDRIIAVCDWVYQALLLNGAPRTKLLLNRQGVADSFAAMARKAATPRDGAGALKLMYLGSWNPLKGVDVVTRAVVSLPPTADVRLDIFAPRGGPEEQAYEDRVRALADGDARVVVHDALRHEDLADAMGRHDALVVPSTWLETGPLVVLEAQASGMFVLGSRLGGIAELVDETDAGMLVAPGDVAAWSAAIVAIASRRNGGGLPAPARPVRVMDNVAEDMAGLYSALSSEGA